MTRLIHLDEIPSLAGQELGVSSWHEVTQEDINKFADATRDYEWFHVDVERATREMGGTIAHGFMTLSWMPFMWHEIAEITGFSGGYNYGCNNVRFTSPVKCGARLRLRATMNPPEEKRGGLVWSIKCVMEVEGQERPALVCDWMEIFYR